MLNESFVRVPCSMTFDKITCAHGLIPSNCVLQSKQIQFFGQLLTQAVNMYFNKSPITCPRLCERNKVKIQTRWWKPVARLGLSRPDDFFSIIYHISLIRTWSEHWNVQPLDQAAPRPKPIHYCYNKTTRDTSPSILIIDHITNETVNKMDANSNSWWTCNKLP